MTRQYDLDQEKTPLFDALKKFADWDPAPFFIPAHKMGEGIDPRFKSFAGENIFKIDVSEVRWTDDFHGATSSIKEAQELAADAWGADRSFFLVNGTSGGIIAAICSVCGEGDRIIVPRNAHKSAIYGLILSGAEPVYVMPEVNKDIGIIGGLNPETLEKAFEQYPDAKAVFTVSPTYHGVISDIASLAEIAHRHGAVLIADEAHGNHTYFSDRLPKGALELGADISCQSTHKMSGALTQASILHIGKGAANHDTVKRSIAGQDENNYCTAGQDENEYNNAGQDENEYCTAGQDVNNYCTAGQDENEYYTAGQDENEYYTAGQDETGQNIVKPDATVRVDYDKIRANLSMIQTTSPSYILLASLDAARSYMATKGEELLGGVIDALEKARAEIAAITGIEVLNGTAGDKGDGSLCPEDKGEDKGDGSLCPGEDKGDGSLCPVKASGDGTTKRSGAEISEKKVIGKAGIFDYEPTRLVISARLLGLDGYELFKTLRENYDIECEFADPLWCVCVAGLGTTPAHIEALVTALKEISDKSLKEFASRLEKVISRQLSDLPGNPGDKAFADALKKNFDKNKKKLETAFLHDLKEEQLKRIQEVTDSGLASITLPPAPPQKMTPRKAWFAARETVPFEESRGRISAEMVVPYPPGIPIICPGEEVTEEVYEYLLMQRNAGRHMHCAAGDSLETLSVVR